uniref:Uncharacterized protein n=1 Tax=viral metagenome TaxID=1070528 RepID=A0A6C0EBT0_9ZZZZ
MAYLFRREHFQRTECIDANKAVPIEEIKPFSYDRSYFTKREQAKNESTLTNINNEIEDIDCEIEAFIEDKIKKLNSIAKIKDMIAVADQAEKFNLKKFDNIARINPVCEIVLHKLYPVDTKPHDLVGNDALLYNFLASRYKYIKISNINTTSYYGSKHDEFHTDMAELYSGEYHKKYPTNDVIPETDIDGESWEKVEKIIKSYSKILSRFTKYGSNNSGDWFISFPFFFQYGENILHGELDKMTDYYRWNDREYYCPIKKGYIFERKGKATTLTCYWDIL